MNPRQRPFRAVAALVLLLGVLGGTAVADTSSVPVTLGVVNGTRTLQVTGADGPVAAGPVSLSFGPASWSSPFGVVVTDLTYDRVGYDVSATLSNLYKLGSDGTHDCAAAVASSGFSVDFVAPTDRLADVTAVVEPLLTFVDDDLTADIETVLPISVGSTLSVTVDSITGLVQDAVEVAPDALMDVTDGTADAGFDEPAAHPSCGNGAADPSSVVLQSGAPAAIDLVALAGALFDAASGTDSTLTAAEAISAGLLPAGADQAGGILWEATRAAIASVLAGEAIGILDAQLDALTDLVVADLLADVTDLLLSLIGQTGAYTNLPVLDLEEAALGDATTGLYHGVMTVTLVDRP